jgi:enoyl-CoA hydratase/carnithine racemase
MTGDVRIIVLRGDVWSLPTPKPPERFGHNLPAERDVAAYEETIAGWQAAFGWLADRADLVSIAAIDRVLSGAGLQLALSCDLRVLTRDVTLGLPETAAGLVPGLGASDLLVDLVGYPTALDMCLTGRRLTAAEALAAGVAQRVVPPDELDQTVAALVAAVLAIPRAAAVETKALLRGALDRGERHPAERRALARAALARCLAGHPAG